MSLTETFKAVSDPVRREILDILRKGPATAGDIAARFKQRDATISHHLSILKNAGLIDSEKNGTFIVYELNTSLFEDIVNWIASLKGADEK